MVFIREMNEPAPVDLVLLQTFHEVARLGSLTAAAARLGRSQPALSHRLRALEDDLGVPLFEKIGRRLVLTEWGRRLQGRCLDLVALAREVRHAVDAEGAIEGTVAIGTLPTVVSHLLVPALSALWARHRRLRLRFGFDFMPQLFEQLRGGQLDLVVAVG